MTEIGTLKELDVKPGDVVECVYGAYHAKTGEKYTANEHCGIETYKQHVMDMSKFSIISRATPAPVEDSPRLWRDMTPEEKGALLLAEHEGKVVEALHGVWIPKKLTLKFFDNIAYRVKPEPKVETVTAYYRSNYDGNMTVDTHDNCGLAEYRITFNLIDGKPDCESVKMEPLA